MNSMHAKLSLPNITPSPPTSWNPPAMKNNVSQVVASEITSASVLYPGNSKTPPPNDIESQGNERQPFQQHSFGAELLSKADGSLLLDHKKNPIPIDKFLATKPLKRELCTRPGPGGKKLTYLSGDSVTRTLNEAFGFDGWCLDIKSTTREVRRTTEKYISDNREVL